MRLATIVVTGFALAMTSASAFAADKVTVSKEIAAAVADKGRPEADTTRDADRKPAESVAFAGVKPGDKVIDLLPGGGYFTRVFAKTVGPTGKVYAVNVARPQPPAGATPPAGAPPAGATPPAIDAIIKEYGNVAFEAVPQDAVKLPDQVDVVWTSLNYHDLKNPGRNMDMLAFNKAIFTALKPGGTYIVIDHAANAGVADAPQTLHRIDPAVVKQEVEAAGFKLAGESDLLKHAADDRTKAMRDNDRGKTDQFFLKFTKPKG